MSATFRSRVARWGRKFGARTAGGLFIGAVFVGAGLGHWSIPGAPTLENLVYDTRVNLSASGEPDPKILILDIDEKSLGSPKLGRWPWSRDRLAEITDILFDHYKIRILTFDVVFAEADNSSGLQSLKALAANELKDSDEFQSILERISPELDFDRRFENSLKGRPVILGYYFNAGKDSVETGELPFPVLMPEDFELTWTDFPEWGGFGSNLSGIVSSSVLSGSFNPIVDADGIVRRIPMLIKFKDEYYETLALATARLHWALKESTDKGGLRLPPITPFPQARAPSSSGVGLPSMEGLRVGNISVPVDASSNVLVPYRGGPKSYRYISLIDVLEKRVDPALLRDTIAVVGTTAPGLVDLRATPVSGIYPGVEVHTNLLSALIDEKETSKIKSVLPNAVFMEFAVVLFVGIALALWMPVATPVAATAAFFGAELILIGTTQWLWSQGTIFPVALTGLLIASLFVFNTAYGFLVEARQKRQFTSLFGQYVPPELVEKMAEDPEKYSMAGRKARLTVLFSDVAGFTSISEQLSPTDLAQYINEYLTSMSNIIRDHGGTLDKYIGDAIMAFWGAPVEEPKHAAQACRAAMLMQVKVAELNSVFAERGWPELRIGVGLSTGDMTVGDMGSKVRKAYTVMGDAVNLGSRLEGLTRMYGNKILASDATFKECPDILFREIDRVRVKGKNEPVTIYEPLGLVGDSVDMNAHTDLPVWSRVLEHYRARDWPEALGLLAQLKKDYPGDGLYSKYHDRVTTLATTELPADWNGITNFETK